MIGKRVRHGGGVGKIAAMGHEGVTLDDGRQVKHGEWQDHDGDDLVEVAHGVQQLSEALPDLLRLPLRSKLGVTATAVSTILRGLRGEKLDPSSKVDAWVLSKLRALRKRAPEDATTMFVSVDRSGDEQPVDRREIGAFLERYGLTERGLALWTANMVYVQARDRGEDDERASAHVSEVVRHHDPEALIDARVRSGYDAIGRTTGGTYASRIRQLVRSTDATRSESSSSRRAGEGSAAQSVRGTAQGQPEARAGAGRQGEEGADVRGRSEGEGGTQAPQQAREAPGSSAGGQARAEA